MFSITSRAVQLYRQEMDLQDGDALQLFVRYAGTGLGFCLGIDRGTPEEGDYIQEIDGIRFFIKSHERWFFEKMSMDYDENGDDFTVDLPSIA